MHTSRLLTILSVLWLSALTVGAQALPRTADGKPNLDGIWQAVSTASADLEDHVAGLNTLAGRSVVEGGRIPYQSTALAKKADNFKNRKTADPAGKCFFPGTPRIMYMDYPFQIFQTPNAVAMAFELSSIYRLIHTDGSKHPEDMDTWMGDSRGKWEGDTLVVDVANFNDETWFDMAGNYHSGAMHVVERYRMTSPDAIQYEATIEDPKVFTKPWAIHIPLRRRADRDRLFEYICQAEVEENNGAFLPEERTWYPATGAPVTAAVAPPAPAAAPAGDRPKWEGFFETETGGANQGLDKAMVAAGGKRRPVIVDPPDGKLPMLPWAVAERVSRNLPERGYDDPTAHCFPPGIPRAMYIPAAITIVQTSNYLVILHERMAWRIIPTDGRPHLPSNMRLWQGDSVGHWEGSTLVVDTTNQNGKEWLNEGGEVMSHAAHVVERFAPSGANISYEATVTDPIVYAKPWRLSFLIKKGKFDMYESTCLETDHDLPHLKALKDAAAAKKK